MLAKNLKQFEVKQAASPTLQQLLNAKAESDRKNYDTKHMILQELINQSPNDFIIDSDEDYVYGITHTPTGFRLHIPKHKTPPAIKAAEGDILQNTKPSPPDTQGYAHLFDGKTEDFEKYKAPAAYPAGLGTTLGALVSPGVGGVIGSLMDAYGMRRANKVNRGIKTQNRLHGQARTANRQTYLDQVAQYEKDLAQWEAANTPEHLKSKADAAKAENTATVEMQRKQHIESMRPKA